MPRSGSCGDDGFRALLRGSADGSDCGHVRHRRDQRIRRQALDDPQSEDPVAGGEPRGRAGSVGHKAGVATPGAPGGSEAVRMAWKSTASARSWRAMASRTASRRRCSPAHGHARIQLVAIQASWRTDRAVMNCNLVAKDDITGLLRMLGRHDAPMASPSSRGSHRPRGRCAIPPCRRRTGVENARERRTLLRSRVDVANLQEMGRPACIHHRVDEVELCHPSDLTYGSRASRPPAPLPSRLPQASDARGRCGPCPPTRPRTPWRPPPRG